MTHMSLSSPPCLTQCQNQQTMIFLLPCSFFISPKTRNKSRGGCCISCVFVSEFLKHVTFLSVCEPNVHIDQHRKHEKCQYSRPLQKESEHDENKAVILRMAALFSSCSDSFCS